MKIYSRKYFILGVIELGFFLFDLWLAWTERNAPVRTAWYDSIKWGLLAVMSFRIAFSRKYAAEALIAEHDEMRKLQEYKAERTAFWVCIWALIWLSCIIEESIIKSQRAFVLGFLLAAGLLLLLRWWITQSRIARYRRER